MTTLFLAWEDPNQRRWLPIGRLEADGHRFVFAYTRGAQVAANEGGFQPLMAFPSFDEVYESDELFPLFANRVPSASREDYAEYVQYLSVPQTGDDPIALLARSGGRRATDSFEVFPLPEPDADGLYHIHFFAHGLRHLSPESLQRIERLQVGEPLLLVLDFQNPHDARALMLRTNDTYPGDRYFVGYCPRYLLDDAFQVLHDNPSRAQVAVERINPPPAPRQLRLLCNLTADWPADFHPCSSALYQPMVDSEMLRSS